MMLAVLGLFCLVALISATPPQTRWQPPADEAKVVAATGPGPAPAARDGQCIPGKQVFNFTGKIEKFTAEKGCVVTIKAWGAGGSNGAQFAPGGGGGGFAKANIVGIGQVLNVLVGEGSIGHVDDDKAWPGQGPFFGGGGKQGNFCGHAGGGGGRSEVTLAIGGRVLLVAGGGGGGGNCKYAVGGGGGGGSGYACGDANSNAAPGGRGATQMSGYKRNEGEDGGDLGGGGGGGYYGGYAGQGHCQYGPAGGGGSSYFSPSLTFSAKLEPATNSTAAMMSDEDYLEGTAMGGMMGVPEARGGHGRIVFSWKPKQ